MNEQRFHQCTGLLVKISSGRTRADRKFPNEEFDNGLVFSDEPLGVDEIFAVSINKTIASWSGSIEIGLTSANPSEMEIAQTTSVMSDDIWLISGTMVNFNGDVINDDYCKDLDLINVDDTVGITRNAQNEIHVFINDIDQGIAGVCDANQLWAVINLYGKCSSISIVSKCSSGNLQADSNRDDVSLSDPLSNASASLARSQVSEKPETDFLKFYSNCGSLIKLQNNGKTAVRLRHEDEFDNGVVMTSRCLKNSELFEIQIDSLTEKWSGSIEIGVTSHRPQALEIPSTMTNLRSGTVMLSGCGIISNGRSTRRKYLDTQLDELKVGDHVGLMRTSSGTLHFFINGVDQGVAANHIPPHVYGVVDLYGRAVSVSIIYQHSLVERSRRNNATANRVMSDVRKTHESLRFSSFCGKHVRLSASNNIATRENPSTDFNHAIVITERPLEHDEVFSVQIEEVVGKWSGSLEIGITTFAPEDFTFPATMTNITSGTWILTSSGVMVNGVTVVDDYGCNLENLDVGHVLGVHRKANGNLHFYINGIDQGLAATDLPETIYGVADLYGRTSKISVFESVVSLNSNIDDVILPAEDISENFLSEFEGLLSYKPNRTDISMLPDSVVQVCRKYPHICFDGCTVQLRTKLQFGKLWELEIQKVIPQWIGSLEIGVTTESNVLALPSSLTEMKSESWVWTGRSTLKNGNLITDTLQHDTEKLSRGSKIGLMLNEKGLVGYYDGVDIGVLFPDASRYEALYPIFNLYGKCAQVTLKAKGQANERVCGASEPELGSNPIPSMEAESSQSFSKCYDRNVVLINAHRVVLKKFRPGIISVHFSAEPLRIGEVFEILINETDLRPEPLTLGVACLGKLEVNSAGVLVENIEDLSRYGPSCLISGCKVWKNGLKVEEFLFPCLSHLQFDDRVGVMLCSDETLLLFYNGAVVGKIAKAFPLFKRSHFVVFLSPRFNAVDLVTNIVKKVEETAVSDVEYDQAPNPVTPMLYTLLCDDYGKNIKLADNGLAASRVDSYDQAMVVTEHPLEINTLFQIRVKVLNKKWKSSLAIGVTGPGRSKRDENEIGHSVSRSTWLIRDRAVFRNEDKIVCEYGIGLDEIFVGQVLGVLIDPDKNLHLYVDGVNQGVAVSGLPEKCHGAVELYGSCCEIQVVGEDWDSLKCHGSDAGPRLRAEKCKHVEKASDDGVCEVLALCTRYLETLGLPKVFFSGTTSCYCGSCLLAQEESKKRSSDQNLKLPPPSGWCKFGLRIHPNVDFSSVSKHWDAYFYGTGAKTLRKLLDHGEIPIKNSEACDLRYSEHCEKMDDAAVTCVADIKPFRNPCYTDTESKRCFCTEVAVQLFVQPTIKNKAQSRDGFSEAEQLVVKEPSATIFSHVLVKLNEQQ